MTRDDERLDERLLAEALRAARARRLRVRRKRRPRVEVASTHHAREMGDPR